MGYVRWDESKWDDHVDSVKDKEPDEIFTSRSLDAALNPLGVKVRESRDSPLNPASTAMIVASDITGSMGRLANYMIRDGLGVLFNEVLTRKPISDPHLMVMGIGDATQGDTAPIQVSQFEADTKIAHWLERVFIEKGGGGNSFESYDLPYYFAAYHTSIDCFEKRGKRGYVFTLGDEEPPRVTSAAAVKKFIGDPLQKDIPFAQVLAAAGRMYHCFHIMIAEGSHAARYPDQVREKWTTLMGQRAIWLKDHTKISETIVSLIEVTEGRDKDAVIGSWSGDTSLVIRDALKGFHAPVKAGGGKRALVRI